jgi:hypothetical protein
VRFGYSSGREACESEPREYIKDVELIRYSAGQVGLRL